MILRYFDWNGNKKQDDLINFLRSILNKIGRYISNILYLTYKIKNFDV